AVRKGRARGAASRTNDFKFDSPAIDLTASPATFQFNPATPVTLQYRFQVFNSGGTMVENALVSGTIYRVSGTLAPNARHTWRVRAEAQGQFGPVSSMASFVTEDPPLINDPLTDRHTHTPRPPA